MMKQDEKNLKQEKILEVKHLTVSFRTGNGKVQAVRDISFDLNRGETLAIVGESGSGKSVTSKAILGISAVNAIHESGEILYRGKDLLQIPEEDFHELRGSQISMVFQDPLSALNPIMRTGKQITEAILFNYKTDKRAAQKRLEALYAAMKQFAHSGEGQANGNTSAQSSLELFQKLQKEQVQQEAAYETAKEYAEEAIRYAKGIVSDLSKRREKEVPQNLAAMEAELEKAKNPQLVEDSLFQEFQRARKSYETDHRSSQLTEALQKLIAEVEARFERPPVDYLQQAYQSLQAQGPSYETYLKQLQTELAQTLRNADIQAKQKRAQVREKIQQNLPVLEARPLQPKTVRQITKSLAKEVQQAINLTDTSKDSVMYTFANTAEHALTRYTVGCKRNIREEKRYKRQQAKFEQLQAAGKNPTYKVVPKDLLDLDWAQDRVTQVYTQLIEHMDQLDREMEETDYTVRANRFMERSRQIAMRAERVVTDQMAKDRAIRLMREVGIPQPELRFKQFPFELSGGMRQRIVIAIALSSNPDILICDEPTTALDVTIQAQILELINEIQRERNLSIIFITHDLGVVANMADRVAVMYAGKIVEKGLVEEVFYEPAHPYTWALLSSMPDLETHETLTAIPGTPPNMLMPPVGDAFAARNRYAMKIDFEQQPPMFRITDTHYAATWLLAPGAPKVELPPIVQERIDRMKVREAANES